MEITIPFLTPIVNNITDFFILLFVLIYIALFFIIQYYLIKVYIWIGENLFKYFPFVKDFLDNHLWGKTKTQKSNPKPQMEDNN